MAKRNILCYGDSNTYGYIPGTINMSTGYKERYTESQRWPMLLQENLREQFHIIEEGLGSRTTNIDDPDKPGRNGLSYLKICLDSHAPLSLVILMLGTNDLNIKYSRTPKEVITGLEGLLHCIKSSNSGADMTSPPEILIVFPPHPSHEDGFGGLFKGAIPFSKTLAKLYESTAMTNGCHFISAADLIQPSDIDGIHLDIHGHKALSKIISAKIDKIFF